MAVGRDRDAQVAGRCVTAVSVKRPSASAVALAIKLSTLAPAIGVPVDVATTRPEIVQDGGGGGGAGGAGGVGDVGVPPPPPQAMSSVIAVRANQGSLGLRVNRPSV
jgi:hypothetical protein